VNYLFENFDDVSNDVNFSQPGWRNLVTKGNRAWRGRVFSGNNGQETYVQATAFQSGLAEMECWLITPPIDFDEVSTLSFLTATSFNVHEGLEVRISTDYDGSNFEFADWELINCDLANSSSAPNTFIPSGSISLNDFNGIGYIAFIYRGNTTDQTSTFRIDDILVE
jgi:hypothetical protein